MSPTRRRFLQAAAGLPALALPRTVRAQTYPSRTMRLIVGFPAGSGPDIIARVVAQALSDRLGQQAVVENRPGAGANLGTEAVAKAAPDGYTLLLTVASNAINVTVQPSPNFDYLRDIAPVAGFASTAYCVMLNPSVPARSVPELIAHAKANPRMLAMASAGNGSSSHVAGELFKQMAGVDILHVPYRGSYFHDLIGGHVHLSFVPLPASVSYYKAGTLRAVAVTSTARTAALPQVPTLAEHVPGYEALGWYGIGTTSGTPQDIIERLSREIAAIVTAPAMKEKLIGLGSEAMPMPAAEFGRLMAAETAKWGKVVRDANIKVE